MESVSNPTTANNTTVAVSPKQTRTEPVPSNGGSNSPFLTPKHESSDVGKLRKDLYELEINNNNQPTTAMKVRIL